MGRGKNNNGRRRATLDGPAPDFSSFNGSMIAPPQGFGVGNQQLSCSRAHHNNHNHNHMSCNCNNPNCKNKNFNCDGILPWGIHAKITSACFIKRRRSGTVRLNEATEPDCRHGPCGGGWKYYAPSVSTIIHSDLSNQ